jgi:hypothetical protein
VENQGLTASAHPRKPAENHSRSSRDSVARYNFLMVPSNMLRLDRSLSWTLLRFNCVVSLNTATPHLLQRSRATIRGVSNPTKMSTRMPPVPPKPISDSAGANSQFNSIWRKIQRFWMTIFDVELTPTLRPTRRSLAAAENADAALEALETAYQHAHENNLLVKNPVVEAHKDIASATSYEEILSGAIQMSLHAFRTLLLFVVQRALVSRFIWLPPRFGNSSSIIAQLKRALPENLAVALRQNEKLAFSSPPYRICHPR